MRALAASTEEPRRAELIAAIRAAIACAQPLSDGDLRDGRAIARALALLWAAYDEIATAPTTYLEK